MEIVFQYIISDTRRFMGEYSHLSKHEPFIEGPLNNQKVREAKTPNVFVKSTGGLYTNKPRKPPADKPKKPQEESSSDTLPKELFIPKESLKELFQTVDFDAKRAIKIKKWLAFGKQKEREGIHIRLFSRKFYFDTLFVSGVYEICFKVFSRNTINVEALLKELLSLHVRISKVFQVSFSRNNVRCDAENEKERWVSLGRAGKVFGGHYICATTQKKHCSDDAANAAFKHIDCNQLHIFIKSDEEVDKLIFPNGCEEREGVKFGKYSLTDGHGLNYRAWLLHKKGNSKNAGDRAYVMTNEVAIFRNSLHFILNRIEKEKLVCDKKSAESDRLQKFLTYAIDKIRQRVEAPGFISAYHEDLSPLDLEQLEKVLKEKREMIPAVSRKVLQYLKEDRKKPEEEAQRKAEKKAKREAKEAERIRRIKEAACRAMQGQKVFISYSHDSKAHKARVLELANVLRGKGIDMELDQYHPDNPLRWPRWCAAQLRNACFVLVVCTPIYKARVEDPDTNPEEGWGVCWEADYIAGELYASKGRNMKYLPILLDRNGQKNIPDILENYPFYTLRRPYEKSKGFSMLFDRLTKFNPTPKPSLGGASSPDKPEAQRLSPAPPSLA